MRHLGLWAVVGLVLSGSSVFAQGGSPFAVPTPQGGPIVRPDGSFMSGMDVIKPKNPWSGGLEAGLNGSEGNSPVLKLRIGGDLKYDTPDDLFILNGWYGLSRQRGILAENKALVTARNEIPVIESLAYFTQGQFEYDAFRDVKTRVGVHNGLSFTAIKTENTLVKLRAGVGASREFGGPEDKWIPEAIFGGDWEQKITDKTKFVAGADYYPDVADWGHYRIRARAAFEILLDQQLNLSLRFGVMDRFDSQPGDNVKRNDLDYFMTLLYKF